MRRIKVVLILCAMLCMVACSSQDNRKLMADSIDRGYSGTVGFRDESDTVSEYGSLVGETTFLIINTTVNEREANESARQSTQDGYNQLKGLEMFMNNAIRDLIFYVHISLIVFGCVLLLLWLSCLLKVLWEG